MNLAHSVEIVALYGNCSVGCVVFADVHLNPFKDFYLG